MSTAKPLRPGVRGPRGYLTPLRLGRLEALSPLGAARLPHVPHKHIRWLVKSGFQISNKYLQVLSMSLMSHGSYFH